LGRKRKHQINRSLDLRGVEYDPRHTQAKRSDQEAKTALIVMDAFAQTKTELGVTHCHSMSSDITAAEEDDR